VVGCLAAGCTARRPDLHPTTVTISSGPIAGLRANLPGALSPVNQFLGIPYAAPPARFEPSTPPAGWKEPLEVNSFGASCPQNYGLGSTFFFFFRLPRFGRVGGGVE
jgi:hypothetical protein